eukprot:scaffold45196_cov283-Amphora_coffeaeformis.AAC.3
MVAVQQAGETWYGWVGDGCNSDRLIVYLSCVSRAVCDVRTFFLSLVWLLVWLLVWFWLLCAASGLVRWVWRVARSCGTTRFCHARSPMVLYTTLLIIINGSVAVVCGLGCGMDLFVASPASAGG